VPVVVTLMTVALLAPFGIAITPFIKNINEAITI
jgi:hypothetical protein